MSAFLEPLLARPRSSSAAFSARREAMSEVGAMPEAAAMPEPPATRRPPSSAGQEIRCVAHWFAGWRQDQREAFLGELVRRAVPGKVWALLGGLGGLGLADRGPPSLFQCQLRLWDRWFQGWTEPERNGLVARLEELEPDFVACFYRKVASTAGED
uniref:uncharacterized protein C14orf119 homolog n=1 Tax=Pristiophorus japonicus TaxID=55135 RepID=UPI00398EBEB4